MSQYRLFVPKQAVGANLVYFDLFNNSKEVVVLNGKGVRVVQGSVASVGNIGFNVGFDLSK